MHIRRAAQHSHRHTVKPGALFNERQHGAQSATSASREENYLFVGCEGAHISADPLRAIEWLGVRAFIAQRAPFGGEIGDDFDTTAPGFRSQRVSWFSDFAFE